MRFEVRALGPQGLENLQVDADTETEARAEAARRGLTVLRIKTPARRLLAPRSRFPLLLFSQELLALLGAGLGLVEAIETLAEKHGDSTGRSVLKQILERLYEGQTFSAALEQVPGVFPSIYVATVRASERTGDLPQALERFVAVQSQLEEVRGKLVAASIYPVLLISVGSLVILFLLGFVVPRFSAIYADLGTEMPFLSRALLFFGQTLAQHGLSILAALVAGVVGLVWAQRRPRVRRWIASRIWRIPGVGERLRVYQLSRFFRTTGMLLRGGVPVVSAIGMSAGLLSAALRPSLDEALRLLREGQSVSNAMETAGLTTPVALRMLRVGERSGEMGELMERIAAFYDREMARWVDWATRVFEPILMLFIGLIIGGVVLLMYMPIFDLAGNLQ